MCIYTYDVPYMCMICVHPSKHAYIVYNVLSKEYEIVLSDPVDEKVTCSELLMQK